MTFLIYQEQIFVNNIASNESNVKTQLSVLWETPVYFKARVHASHVHCWDICLPYSILYLGKSFHSPLLCLSLQRDVAIHSLKAHSA